MYSLLVGPSQYLLWSSLLLRRMKNTLHSLIMSNDDVLNDLGWKNGGSPKYESLFKITLCQ